MGQIIDDPVDLCCRQYSSLNLAANGLKTVRRRRRRNGDQTAFRFGETPECRFRQADASRAYQCVVVCDQKGCQENLGIATELYPAEPAKNLRTQCPRPA
jgi:hypothetical protein